MTEVPCVGLFGTCGGSQWRASFIAAYKRHGIRYFNPQVDAWTPECADIEAAHLRRDRIILFPVTSETYAVGSLAESGFSILQAIRDNTGRFVIVMIEQTLDVALSDAGRRDDSLRARKLVLAHLAENPHANVFLVNTLDEMLCLSIELWDLTEATVALAERTADVQQKWRSRAAS
jgi:hypothetical protein